MPLFREKQDKNLRGRAAETRALMRCQRSNLRAARRLVIHTTDKLLPRHCKQEGLSPWWLDGQRGRQLLPIADDEGGIVWRAVPAGTARGVSSAMHACSKN